MGKTMWSHQPTAGHETHGQSAIYDDATGKTVAIVYDGDKHAPTLAAAPDLLEAVKAVLAEHLAEGGKGIDLPQSLLAMLNTVVAKAEGK